MKSFSHPIHYYGRMRSCSVTVDNAHCESLNNGRTGTTGMDPEPNQRGSLMES